MGKIEDKSTKDVPTSGNDVAPVKLTKKQEAAASKSRLKRITKSQRHAVRTNNRVVKYGAKSFVRNAWLSLAAIAMMTITLVVLAATVIATNVLGTAIGQVENQVDYSIYIKQTATNEQIANIVTRMEALESVTEVKSKSPETSNDEAIKKMIKDNNITDPDAIKVLYQAPNMMPWILNVKVVDIDDTTEIENFVDNDSSMRNMLDAKEPTYKSENRNTVNRIAGIMNRIRLAGLAAAGVFAIIAILVVFNTIRMSIYNRKEEIYMMRLVGASRWFIIGPFVVEASFYGIISSVIAAVIGFFGTFALRDSIGQALMDPTINLMQTYWLHLSASIMFIGVMIGVVSALLATRKYVKVK